MKKLIGSLLILFPLLSFAGIIDESPEEKRGVVRNGTPAPSGGNISRPVKK